MEGFLEWCMIHKPTLTLCHKAHSQALIHDPCSLLPGTSGCIGKKINDPPHTNAKKVVFPIWFFTVRLTTFIFHQDKHGEDVFLRKGQIPNSLNILTCYQSVSIDCLSSVQGVVALEVTRKRLNEISFSNIPAFWIRNKFNTFRDG